MEIFSLFPIATSLRILIKCVGVLEIRPDLNLGSAPATLKYLNIIELNLSLLFNKYSSVLTFDSP